MDEPNKKKLTTPKSISEFYDLLAPDYDAMTDFDKRFSQERQFFQSLIERFAIKKALDAGCGTGFHAVLLSQLGVDVTAADVSSEMLRLMRQNARRYDVAIKAVEGSFADLATLTDERFGAVFVMGNSLAHLLNAVDLKRALQSFADLLQDGGIIFSQILNYERILATRDRIQNSREAGNKTFTRFYDFVGDEILFTIVSTEKGIDGPMEQIRRIRLRPVMREEIVRLLDQVGFGDIEVFGGISMVEYNPLNSKDLVVLARKKRERAH